LPIGVVGASAGAGLAAYLALTEAVVKAAMLWVPIVTWDFGSMDTGLTSSWQRFQQSPFLSSDKMKWFRTMYIKEKDWSKPMASPLTVLKDATTHPLAGLPDFRVAVAGGDVLKDQGVQFAELANIAAETSKRYNGGSVDRVVLKIHEGTGHSLISAAGENEIGRREVVEGSEWIADKLSRVS
jgi:acetyl esterase/lipase